MDRIATGQKLREGRDAWNAWAAKALERREQLETEGQWNSADKKLTKEADAWKSDATADFDSQHFSAEHSFEGFIFPGRAIFANTKFAHSANFSSTVFHGDCSFSQAIFHGALSFRSASFGGVLDLERSTLFGPVHSDEATFAGQVLFRQLSFPYTLSLEKAQFANTVYFESCAFNADVRLSGALFKEAVDFDKAVFSGETDLSEIKFEDRVTFEGAKFHRQVWFYRTVFSRKVWFEQSTFEGRASFDYATFQGIAHFDGSHFFAETIFSSARFDSRCVFDHCTFEGVTDFSHVTFQSDASFVAVVGETYFTLRSTTFGAVPDFEQAHFSEAPRLDNTSFQLRRSRRPDPDVSARWRALKRLAIQGHDHEREQIFFAAELKSLRGIHDKPWPNFGGVLRGKMPTWSGGSRFYVGIAYQIFSDFGRSILRPFLWWIAAVVVATAYYLWRHFAVISPSYPTSALNWLWRSSVDFVISTFTQTNHVSASAIHCIEGSGTPLSAAIYLAIHNGSIVASLGGSDKLKQAHTCLYGSVEDVAFIPDSVVYGGMLQTLVSAVLVFLFILAIRNHFRIR